MKIATYKDGSRDGQLVVVSRDLAMAHYATGIAGRLQQVLDDWNFLSPQLEELSQTLHTGKARHAFAFDPRLCMAPLPRAFHLASPELDQPSRQQPQKMRTHRSDDLLGPCAPLPVGRDADVDPGNGAPLFFAAQLAVLTGDLSAGAAADDSLAVVRLITACAIWYRSAADLPGCDAAIGASFSAVAVTPDELGAGWRDGEIDLDLQISVNGKSVPPGRGRLTTRHIGNCLAACAALRGLRCGGIVGLGPAGMGLSSIAGGDSLRIVIDDARREGVFGAISTTIDVLG